MIVIVENDRNADWLITAQALRKARDGTPTDLDLAGAVAKAYNPDQPRDPKGTSTGGQWTDAGGAPAQQQWQRKYLPEYRYERNAEALANERIKETASRHGATPERVRDEATNYLTRLLDAPLVVRAKLDGALAIVNEGRFKSQFESGKSNGWFNPDFRADAERKGLGVPEDIDPGERPIYGCFDFRGDDGGAYGEIKFTLKESVKQRTTFTVSDSLSYFGDGVLTGSLASEPHDTGAWDSYVDALYRGRPEFSYLEAQIHGGVTLDDVESVTFMNFAIDFRTGKPRASERQGGNDWLAFDKLLRSRGIKVKYDQETA